MSGENTKIYKRQGGDVLVIESGAQILFGTAQAAALTTTTLAALTTTSVASLSTTQTSNLTTNQLAALCVNNDALAAALPALQTKVNAISVALTNLGILAAS